MFLTALGYVSTNEGLVVRIAAENQAAISDSLKKIVEASPVELLALVGKAKNLQCEKWDWALPKDFLIKSYATTRLDLPGAQNEAARLLTVQM
jgi:ATP-dependent Lhr-like helicase